MGRAKRYGNPKVVIKIIDDCTGANKNVERVLKEELGKLIETPRSGDDSAVPETQPLGDDAYSAVLAKLEAYAAAKREIISLHMGGVTANLGAMLRSNGVPVDVVIRKMGGLDKVLEEKAIMGASDATGSGAKVSKKEFKVAFVKGIKEAAPNHIDKFGEEGDQKLRTPFLPPLLRKPSPCLHPRTPPLQTHRPPYAFSTRPPR